MPNILFNNRIKFLERVLKNNKNLVIILPTILGSITQIFALISINNSVSYLKFFSITQIVPDSLIFLLVIIVSVIFDLAITYFFGRLTIRLKAHFFNTSFRKVILNDNRTKVIVIMYISIFTFITSVVNFISINRHYIQTDNIYEDKIKSVFLVFISLFCYLLLYSLGNFTLHRRNYSLYFFFLFIFTFIILHDSFIRNTSQIDNNANFKHVNELIKTNLNLNNPKIIYFNDQYIFYDISDEEIQEIYIYKLENIFY